MSTPPPPAPLSQVEYWNGATGHKWRALQPALDATLAPLGQALLEAAAAREGERGLDIGCGCGDTSLALARAVGHRGRVFGIDVSRPMLARAEERRAEARFSHLTFHETDAETTPLPGSPADLLVSRFGIMFFADEARAFAALARALKPQARAAFLVWAAPEENPWLTLAMGAIAPLLPAAPPAPPPNAPGPFRHADPARLEALLRGGGFAGIAVEKFSAPLAIGGGFDRDAAAHFLIQLGPGAALLKDADDALKARAFAAVREALTSHATPQGVVLDAAVWVTTARRG
jgi:SAM-dependent methyltransferase